MNKNQNELWIKMNQYQNQIESIWKIKVNQNESLQFVRFESESKWTRIKNKMIRRGESKIKKDFDSTRESKSLCEFRFPSANQKFANLNESIRYEPYSRLLLKLAYNNPKSLLTLNSLRWVNFGRCERRRYSSRMFEWSIEPEKRYRSKFSAHTITHNQLNVSIRC